MNSGNSFMAFILELSAWSACNQQEMFFSLIVIRFDDYYNILPTFSFHFLAPFLVPWMQTSC